jgi:hypothetical protein
MKTRSKHHARHLPTWTDHISFGKVGLGPEGERFIYIAIGSCGPQHKVLLRYDDFVDGSGHALARLNTLGAHLISPTARSEFLRRLQDLGPQAPSFSVATRVGPFGKAFVLPDQVLSATEENFATWFDDSLADYLSWARKGGTMKKWKTLAALVEGNSRLILGLGVAFVGPLRLITPVESIAFQLTGLGGTGKTSIKHLGSTALGRQAPPTRQRRRMEQYGEQFRVHSSDPGSHISVPRRGSPCPPAGYHRGDFSD